MVENDWQGEREKDMNNLRLLMSNECAQFPQKSDSDLSYVVATVNLLCLCVYACRCRQVNISQRRTKKTANKSANNGTTAKNQVRQNERILARHSWDITKHTNVYWNCERVKNPKKSIPDWRYNIHCTIVTTVTAAKNWRRQKTKWIIWMLNMEMIIGNCFAHGVTSVIHTTSNHLIEHLHY